MTKNHTRFIRKLLDLEVYVAERGIIQSSQQFTNGPRVKVQAIHLDDILQYGVSTWRVVEQGNGPRDALVLVEVQCLPNPPDTVQHCVVHEKDGIIGAAEEVAGVATN